MSYRYNSMSCCSYRSFRTLCYVCLLGLVSFSLKQSSQVFELTSRRPDDVGLGLPVQLQFQWTEGRNYSSHPITAAESKYMDHQKQQELPSRRPDDVGLGLPVQFQFQWTEGRNYSSHPITAAESKYLDHQKQQLPAKYSDITTAICHRTLYGNLNIEKVFSFVSYYRLLGFDHIFFWHRPAIAQRPRFNELKALPYVTLTQYAGGGSNHGQLSVERQCLSRAKFAANFSWAFPIDLDEYLWYRWSEPVYKFVVHRLTNFHYVSIGKFMYTQRHAVALERNDSGFGLDPYAFTAGSYCYNHGPNDPKEHDCPTWRGRAKILVQPSLHKSVLIHGNGNLHRQPGGTHLLPMDAHLKEWPKYLASSVNTTVRPDRIPFYVSRTDEVDTHWTMESHNKTEDGLVPFWYDDQLHDWFRFVAQGCPRDYQTISPH
jgi:hypothetical protein